MPLTSETVAEGLAILGSAFRRRISAETILVYHRVLHERLDEKQFETAVKECVEHEDEFPTAATLLRRGESVSRFEGVPYVRLEGQEVPLREYLDRIKEGTR